MGSDYKVLLDVEEGLITPAGVTVVRETPSAGARWRVCGAVLAMALCVSAALFFTWHHQKQHHVEEADDIRHTLRAVSGSVKAAIHLEGEYNETSSTLQWMQDVDQAFAQGGLELENNEIVIPKTGLYFVYSQVSFRANCSARKSLVHLSQTVMRRSDSYGSSDDNDADLYRPLLHSIRTTCESLRPKNRRPFNTVYGGAVFKLEEGDRLKTNVEKEQLPILINAPGKNFFGVFAL